MRDQLSVFSATVVANNRVYFLLSMNRLMILTSIMLLIIISISSEANATLGRQYKNGMHVILTGVGTLRSVRGEGGSGVAVIVDGSVLQFDMGPRTVGRLVASGISPARVGTLFITHLHMDHISEMPLFLSYNFGESLKVFGPPGTKMALEGVKLMMNTHRESLKSLYAVDIAYEVTELEENGVVLKTDEYTVTAVSTPHLRKKGVHSFAYRVQSKYGSVVISGDTAPSQSVVELAKNADLLIHEVFFLDLSMVPKSHFENMFRMANVNSIDKLKDGLRAGPPKLGHTTPAELGKVAKAANVGKVVAYHLPPLAYTEQEKWIAENVWGLKPYEYDPDNAYRIIESIRKNYKGVVLLAEPLMTLTIGEVP